MFNQVFDLTETKNMREITPIHRAVIKSNYAAVNSMLQSAITIRRMLQERIETPSESKMLLSYVPRSILD
jgi:ankyrin repeat protein